MLNFPQIWHYVIVSDNKLRIQFTKSLGLPTPSHSPLFGTENIFHACLYADCVGWEKYFSKNICQACLYADCAG